MRKTAKCTCCNAEHFTAEMVQTKSPKKGMRNAYICRECASRNHSYHTSNTQILGTAKVNNVNCGIEFETSFTDEYARQIMFEYDFIATHDCSLSSDGNGNRYGYDGNTCEYVSGIMQGLNKASKFALTCDKLVNENHMKVNASCGTHFHISIDSMKDQNGQYSYMGYIRRFYNSLFVPLCSAMLNNPQATEQLFGRNFTNYAKSINMYTTQSSHNDRYYFINCLADNNIEFRLNKFVNGKQYQKLMKLEVEIVKCVVTNFCEHFNDTNIDSRRYANKTEYRKHKAQVTANKIVKLFEKAIAE